MKKKYIKPTIKSHKLASNSELMFGSIRDNRDHNYPNPNDDGDDDDNVLDNIHKNHPLFPPQYPHFKP